MATTESSAPPWREVYLGGSAETERETFERLARTLMQVQLTTTRAAARSGVPQAVDRAFHAKVDAGAGRRRAAVRGPPTCPRTCAPGFAQPGAAYPTTVRFSNAAGAGRRDDASPTCAGVALRVQVSPEESHDLLATNYPVSHARDARQFVEFAAATAGGRLARLLGLLRLVRLFGPPGDGADAAQRPDRTAGAPVGSVASRRTGAGEPMRWGPTWRCATCSVRSRAPPRRRRRRRTTPTTSRTEARPTGLRPVRRASSSASSATSTRRRRRSRTPAVEWTETVSPPVPVAVLTLPQGDLTAVDALAAARRHRRARRSTRGTRPRSSARSATSTAPARRPTTPAPRTGSATAGRRARRCATVLVGGAARGRLRASSTAASSGTGSRCGSACSTSTRSATSCGSRT